MQKLAISDVAIWFKHIHAKDLLARLESLAPEDEIVLSVDRVVGRWKRMKTGKDGRPVHAIRPVGPMKDVWSVWYKSRRGEHVDVEPVQLADDLLESTSGLMSEWSSEEDESAFRDL